jgi:hypothetical protein
VAIVFSLYCDYMDEEPGQKDKLWLTKKPVPLPDVSFSDEQLFESYRRVFTNTGYDPATRERAYTRFVSLQHKLSSRKYE